LFPDKDKASKTAVHIYCVRDVQFSNRWPSIAVTVLVVKTGHGGGEVNGVIIIIVQSELVSSISISAPHPPNKKENYEIDCGEFTPFPVYIYSVVHLLLNTGISICAIEHFFY